LPHHDQQASSDRNQTEHGRMLPSNMLLLNPILLIDVTFSTPTPGYNSDAEPGSARLKRRRPDIRRHVLRGFIFLIEL
jgi:hypothetical protein